jgi:hypothetical protein
VRLSLAAWTLRVTQSSTLSAPMRRNVRWGWTTWSVPERRIKVKGRPWIREKKIPGLQVARTAGFPALERSQEGRRAALCTPCDHEVSHHRNDSCLAPRRGRVISWPR